MYRATTLAIALLASCLSPRNAPRHVWIENGVHVRFTACFDEGFVGDRQAVLTRAREIIQTRVIALAPGAQVGIEDDASLFVWLPAGTVEQVERVRKVAERAGRLEFLEVAGPAEHAAYYASESIPDGFDALECHDGLPEHGITNRILVARFAIVTEADFDRVTAEPGVAGPRSWRLACTLKEEAAKRLDMEAARAFARSPRGLIAIVSDGIVHSVPQVASDRFGGQFDITGGFDELTAKGLAATLGSGRLPVPLEFAGDRDIKRPPSK